MSRSEILPRPMASSTVWFTTPIALTCVAIRCVRNGEGRNRRAKARRGLSIVEAGTRAAAPFPAPLSPPPAVVPPLRSGQVFLDEAEHFLHNRDASVATLRD